MKAKDAKKNTVSNFGKNVIDPFSAIFEMAGFELDTSQWKISEEVRQAQKTLQNFVGEFHQEILGSCQGWQNLKTGNIVDIVNLQAKRIAEIKNKHNTISGGSLVNVYHTLEEAVMPKTSIYKDFTAYYVVIIPKKPKRFDIPFTPANKQTGKKCQSNELIRQIDGASFYEIVTGKKDALEELFDILPGLINSLDKKSHLDKAYLKTLFKKAYG